MFALITLGQPLLALAKYVLSIISLKLPQWTNPIKD